MNITNIKKASMEWFKNIVVPDDYKNRLILNDSDKNLTIIGMRRLGKTEFLNYKAKESKLDAEEILFIDLDNPIFSSIDFEKRSNGRDRFIKTIDDMLSLGKIKMILLDEIQILLEWGRVLKGLIDKYKDVRFYATGSDAIKLIKGGETGVGRFQIRYMGIYSFVEYLSLNSKEEYLDNFSFPPNEKLSLIDRYQAVIEKQMSTSGYKLLNLKSLYMNIALNPGIKLTKNGIVRAVTDAEDASFDNKQVESLINFLIESQLILSIPDKYSIGKPSKRTIYTLYPFDWNSHKYFNNSKSYEELETKINKEDKIKNLPTSGFVFENMIISNLYSMFNNALSRNKLSNKVDQPDVDIYVGDQAYEIKSFDIKELSDEGLLEIINKAKETNSIIVHNGKTESISEVSFINWKEFLKEMYKESIK